MSVVGFVPDSFVVVVVVVIAVASSTQVSLRESACSFLLSSQHVVFLWPIIIPVVLPHLIVRVACFLYSRCSTVRPVKLANRTSSAGSNSGVVRVDNKPSVCNPAHDQVVTTCYRTRPV